MTSVKILASSKQPGDADVSEEDALGNEQENASAPVNKNAGIVWGLLQKGLKKAMGPTRDQLEFTIKIRSMFDGFDQSGDGQLSGNELRKALNGLGVHISKKEMKSLMMRFDQNHDDEIDHSEFEDMVRDLIPPPEFDIGGIFLEQKLKVQYPIPIEYNKQHSVQQFSSMCFTTASKTDSSNQHGTCRPCLCSWTLTGTNSLTVNLPKSCKSQTVQVVNAFEWSSHDQIITADEMRSGLAKLGLHMTPDHMDRIIKVDCASACSTCASPWSRQDMCF